MAIRNLQERLFEGLWQLVSRAPRRLIAAALLVAVGSALLAVLFLRLDSDQDQLVSPDVPFQKRYLEHLQNFGDQEYLYTVIEVDDSPDGRARAQLFAEDLARRLRERPELIQAIYYRITVEDLGQGMLYYAPLQEAERLTAMAKLLGPMANEWLRDGRLARFIEQLASLLGRSGEAAPTVSGDSLVPALGALESLFAGMNEALAGKASTGPYLDFAIENNQYFFTDNGRLLVMRLLPVKDFGTMDVIAEPLAFVRQSLAETQTQFPEVHAGLTGRPVLQADEMATTDQDMTRASLLAVVLVGLFFVLILHGWLRPLLVIGCLLLAMAWTFGFTTATLGVLNLLSIVFALVLIGIGVDFGVHIVMRFIEGRQAGLTVEQAVRTALVQTGPGVLLGAATSVCAFYAVLGSDFRGLAELGLIGGTGILFCLVAMLVVLPALLLLAGKKNLFPVTPPRMLRVQFLERITDRPYLLLTVLTVITLALAPGLNKIRFNFNLLELQAEGLESVKYEQRLIEASNESTWYAIAVADDLAQVESLRQRFLALPSVGKVESLLDLLPANQQRKQHLFKEAVGNVSSPSQLPVDLLPPSAAELRSALNRLQMGLEGLEEQLFAAGAGSELVRLASLLAAVDAVHQQLTVEPASAKRLAGLQQGLGREVAGAIGQLRRWLQADPVLLDDLPSSLRDIYVGRDGRLQVKVIPKENVWDFALLQNFVRDLRQVDEHVSGIPIGVLESARLMQRTFLSAALLTLALVSLLLWLVSRSVRQVLLTLLPLAVSMVWLLELMGWCGLTFNLANFFAIPILIAIGVDGGVHFLARWQEDADGRLFATSTPMAVALSFITTMIGFGGLLLGHHQGLASLGAVMVLGSATGMFSCLLVLPAVLKLRPTTPAELGEAR